MVEWLLLGRVHKPRFRVGQVGCLVDVGQPQSEFFDRRDPGKVPEEDEDLDRHRRRDAHDQKAAAPRPLRRLQAVEEEDLISENTEKAEPQPTHDEKTNEVHGSPFGLRRDMPVLRQPGVEAERRTGRAGQLLRLSRAFKCHRWERTRQAKSITFNPDLAQIAVPSTSIDNPAGCWRAWCGLPCPRLDQGGESGGARRRLVPYSREAPS